MHSSTKSACKVNDTSVNERLAGILVQAELDEYRVANYQVTLFFVKSVGAKLRRISIIFDCNASIISWKEAMHFEVLRDDEVACRQKFLGDLFLLFGCPVKEVATKSDGGLCIKFSEEQVIVLHVAEEELIGDDWVWRIEDEKGDDGDNVQSVSCVVVQADNRRSINFLVK